MIDTATAIILSICIVLAALAAFICAATLAVASPWWPQRKRMRHPRSSSRASISPVNFLSRTIEAFALTSPRAASRNRNGSRSSSIFAESQSLPLRFYPERLYGSTSSHHSPTRSSFSANTRRDQTGLGVTTIGGFLAPPIMRPRAGSTSVLHDLAKGSYEDKFLLPASTSSLPAQPETPIDELSSTKAALAKGDSDTAMRRKSLIKARRTTLGTLSPKPFMSELGASMSGLVSVLGLQMSRSTQNSPLRNRASLSATVTRGTSPTISRIPPVSCCFTKTDAPGGTMNYRIFIDATGKNNLTVRVHLYYATNLPTARPWKNSNYIVKAELIGFKSHFVQTSGVVTASCGSPQFFKGNPSVLDFVIDCGMPFNKSEEDVRLKLSIIEFTGRKPGEKSLLVATKEYQFNHHTLKGKSTISTEINCERCKSCTDVYQVTADVLTSLTQSEVEGNLRFEIHEVRNLSYRLLTEAPEDTSVASKRMSLTPIKLRLRACLVTNGRATCVRKGFNIRLPTEFIESVTKGESSPALILREHVFNSSELILTFRQPFQSSFDKPEVFSKVGVRPVQWRILAYFVLILEDNLSHSSGTKRVRAIGSCCLGSNAQNSASAGSTSLLNDGIIPHLSKVASESSQAQVSQWLHVE
ncbi:hypothetical protein Aperf_G00000005235 [Anoplocephala perfoliata]